MTTEKNRKVAVITGASSGIGRATAERLAQSGTRIVIGTYPGDPHDPAETADLVQRAGSEAIIFEVDVRKTPEVDALIASAVEHWGRLDNVIAAAGILRKHPIGSLTDDFWDDMLEVDLKGVFRTLRAGAEHLTAGGSMVAVSSIAGGVYGWGEHAHYATAKAGVLGLVRSLAVELAPSQVRVNAIIPGLIETPQSTDAENSLGPHGLKAAGQYIPWGRVGTAQEVASVVDFLSGQDAQYITGQALIVDGGLTVAMRE